jgi:hypothetical protein
MKIQCPRCKHTQADSNFCANCGIRFTALPAKNGNAGIIAVTIIGVVIGMCTVAGIVASLAKKPEPSKPFVSDYKTNANSLSNTSNISVIANAPASTPAPKIKKSPALTESNTKFDSNSQDKVLEQRTVPEQVPSYERDDDKNDTLTARREYITGPRGGCYYINGSGNKTYVDRSFCGGSVPDSNPSGYIRGPRGGCYYINSGGNKTYVDRSLCN